MTISANRRLKKFLGNGVTTVFPYDFFIPDEGSVYVIRYDASTAVRTLLSSSEYSVTGIGSASFGNITYPLTGDALPAGSTLVIVRLVDYTQEVDIINQDTFYPDIIEGEFDDLVMQTQQLANGVDRSIQVIEGDSLTALLPAAAARAGMALVFDGVGQPTVSLAIPTGSMAVASEASARAGTSNTEIMTPLRVAEAIDENLVAFSTRTLAVADNDTTKDYLKTYGYATPGDGGGALYTKVVSDPGSGGFQNAGGTWYALAEWVVTPLMVGAAGNGTTEDATALAEAILATPTGGELNGLGKTYKCSSPLTLKANFKLANIVLSATDMIGTGKLLNVTGTVGATSAVSAGNTARSNTLTIPSTAAYSPNDWIVVQSADVWDTEDGAFFTEIHQVKSKTATVLTLYSALKYSMPTTCTVALLTTVNNLVLESVTARGSGADTQWGAELRVCKDLVIRLCDFQFFNDRCFAIWRGINPLITENKIGHCNSALAYGIQIEGATLGAKITENTFLDCNRGVDFGDDDGPNRSCVMSGNVLLQMHSGGIGSHPCADDIIISDNVIECDPNNVAISAAIDYNGANPTITGNRCMMSGTSGIRVNDKTTGASASKAIISDNEVWNVGGTFGILIEKLGPAADNMESAIVTGNNIRHVNGAAGTIGIWILAVEGSIDDVIVNDNEVRGFRQGILLDTDGTEEILGFSVNSNVIYMPAGVGTEGIFLSAATDGNIHNGCVNSNIIKNVPTIGIRGVGEENIVVNGNNCAGAGTAVSISATNNVNANNLA